MAVTTSTGESNTNAGNATATSSSRFRAACVRSPVKTDSLLSSACPAQRFRGILLLDWLLTLAVKPHHAFSFPEKLTGRPQRDSPSQSGVCGAVDERGTPWVEYHSLAHGLCRISHAQFELIHG